jgi:hypothetical protein
MTAEDHVEAVEAPPLSMPSDTPREKESESSDANGSTPAEKSSKETKFSGLQNNAFFSKNWTIISWTPKRCRWDPENPPKFSLALNLLFAFVSSLHIFYHALSTFKVVLYQQATSQWEG